MVGFVFYIAHFAKFTKFAIHNVKTRFPFLYASNSLDRNFDSCLSIRCLAPQQILRFFFSFFAAGVAFAYGNCAHYCVVLLNATLSDRDWKRKKRWKKVSPMGYVSREILIYRHWRQEVPLYHCFAVSGGEIISWCDASCLRTFMSLNLAFDFGRNTTRTIL